MIIFQIITLLLLSPIIILCQTSKLFCHDIPFCSRNMFFEPQAPVYFINPSSLSINPTTNIFKASLQNLNKDYISNANDLELTLFILKSGMFRILIFPSPSNRFTFDSNDLPFDISRCLKQSNIKFINSTNNLSIYYFTKSTKYELIINYHPFSIHYNIDNKLILSINNKNLFDIEYPHPDFVSTELDSMSSIKMDILFKESFLITGLPLRASDLFLEDTKEDLYYHFYNTDTFKYPKNNYEGLYGVIPYFMSHTRSHYGDYITGFIWNNPSETFIAVNTNEQGKEVMFVSESGVFDFVFFSDKDINHYYKIYHRLTGYMQLPPEFTLGYHQSRFSYKSLDKIKEIDYKFDEYNIPYDVIHFDIDHTIEKKYFTWNENFKGIDKWMEIYQKKGREIVVIIDPHIKVDKKYFLYDKANKHNYFVKYEGHNFIGKCWCGDASYLDLFNNEVREYYKTLFNSTLNNNYFYNPDIMNIWNDMNEPSVFEISRNTIPKTATIIYNRKEYEHRAVHNVYGYMMHKSTYEGLLNLNNNKRPFILTRSFYLGSHKYSAMWIGDSISNFEHLQLSISMLLSLSVSGFSFIGADVGGFADNAKPNLMNRWYQLGIFYPFFRGHSHESTYQREIWLYEYDLFMSMKKHILLRYQILPYIYNEFYKHHLTGFPIMLPVYFEERNEYTLNKYANIEFLFGESILIRPVISHEEDSTNIITVYLPNNQNQRWFNFYSLKEYTTLGEFNLAIDMETIGAFIKGGNIIPKKMRQRRCTKLMKKDPYTLFVTLDKSNKSEGVIYLDDTYTFNYKFGEYSKIKCEYVNSVLTCEWVKYDYKINISIESVIFAGIYKDINEVSIFNNGISGIIDNKYVYHNKKEGVLKISKLNKLLNMNSEIRNTIKLYLN